MTLAMAVGARSKDMFGDDLDGVQQQRCIILVYIKHKAWHILDTASFLARYSFSGVSASSASFMIQR